MKFVPNDVQSAVREMQKNGRTKRRHLTEEMQAKLVSFGFALPDGEWMLITESGRQVRRTLRAA